MKHKDGPLRMFLEDLGSVAIPTPAEERALGLRVMAGDVEARNELWVRNLPFVIRTATAYHQKYRGLRPGMTMDHLVSAGSWGLYRAVDLFNPAMGRLTTLASYHVLVSIKNVCDEDTTVHTPKWVISLARKIRNNPGFRPQPLQAECITKAAASFRGASPIAFDFARKEEEDDGEDSPIATAVRRLRPADRDLIERYFGMNGRARETQKEIALAEGVTRPAIDRRLKRAYGELRDFLEPQKEAS